ncbi:MAG: hypothetical protein N7Q72_07655, partial [Spiroplasma sp. Tabriz.8]|nr:hypothetical protein [Spiroplasma sp. Tabriz.8]
KTIIEYKSPTMTKNVQYRKKRMCTYYLVYIYIYIYIYIYAMPYSYICFGPNRKPNSQTTLPSIV